MTSPTEFWLRACSISSLLSQQSGWPLQNSLRSTIEGNPEVQWNGFSRKMECWIDALLDKGNCFGCPCTKEEHTSATVIQKASSWWSSWKLQSKIVLNSVLVQNLSQYMVLLKHIYFQPNFQYCLLKWCERDISTFVDIITFYSFIFAPTFPLGGVAGQ